eukprot:scaffold106323_cov28-Tisochrysis_lutea.AAC.1
MRRRAGACTGFPGLRLPREKYFIIQLRVRDGGGGGGNFDRRPSYHCNEAGRRMPCEAAR